MNTEHITWKARGICYV